MIYYKIRNKNTGLFHKGGYGFYSSQHWNKTGKTWDTLGKLRAMITSNINSHYTVKFDEWEIIEYEVQELAVKSISDIIDPKKLVDLLNQ